MTFLPGPRWLRNMERFRESSAGTIEAPADAIPQRLTEAERIAALALRELVVGETPVLPDDEAHDLEAAVWRAVEEGRHQDDPERWLARVGYLRDGYRRDRARRARLAG